MWRIEEDNDTSAASEQFSHMETRRQFKKLLPKSTIEKILSCVSKDSRDGIASLSHTYIRRLLFRGCREGHSGGTRCSAPTTLTDVQTLAVLTTARVSLTSLRVVSSMVLQVTGLSVLASAAKVDVLMRREKCHSLQHGLLRATEPVEGTEDDPTVVSIPYCWECPRDAVERHLLELVARSSDPRSECKSLGPDPGDDGLALAHTHMGDHGQGAMTYLSCFCFFEDAGQKHSSLVGHFEERDGYETQARRLEVLKKIDEGVGKLNNSPVISIEWDGGIDIAIIPRGDYECSPGQRVGLPPGFRIVRLASDGTTCGCKTVQEVTSEEFKFSRGDIPTNYEVKCLPVISFLSCGDTRQLMLMQGGGDFCSCRCPSPQCAVSSVE